MLIRNCIQECWLIRNDVPECPPEHKLKFGTCSKCLIIILLIVAWHDYEVVLTTTCRLELSREIMARLQHTPQCASMFRASCFGAYVNMLMSVKCHPLLSHYLMCKEYTTYHRGDLKKLLFLVHDYHVCFDMKAFCLIIGLQFKEYFHPTSFSM